MKLSDFEGDFFHVVRDGEFDTLGILVSNPQKPYLCFAEAENFLINCCEKKDVSCIICTEELKDNIKLQGSGKGIAVCKSPRTAFYTLHNYLAENSVEYNFIRQENKIGKGCNIHPTAIIAERGVEIGNNVIVEEYAVIREGVSIGDNVIIRSGAIIGGSNQIVSHTAEGELFLVKQIGRAKLHNNIEVAYHALIACGMFPYEMTEISDNCCIDTDTLVAHNSKIGKNSMVLAQSQVCGSTCIGENVRISPQAIVSNCLRVENNATITIGAVVVNNVRKGLKMSGNFAIEHSKFLKWHMKKNR